MKPEPLRRTPVVDYGGLNSSFLRRWALRRVAERIPPSTRAHVRVRHILRALADVEESEREFSSSWSGYRRSRWLWWGAAAWAAFTFVVSCTSLFTADRTRLSWLMPLIVFAMGALFAAGVMPAMRRASKSLLEHAVTADETLREAERRLEVLIRQPFAADPWASIRATVVRSHADSGQESVDTVEDDKE